jgi:hypothetical protein
MDKLGSLLAVVLNALKGLGNLVGSLLGSFLRKTDAQAASEKINEAVKNAEAAANLRAKIAEVKHAKVEAKLAEEKSRDAVEGANDLLGRLRAGAGEDSKG